MAKTELVIAFIGTDLAAIKKFFPNGYDMVSWVYLGKDFFKRRRIVQELEDRFGYIDIAKMLNEVANEIRSEHVKWIDDLNRCFGERLEWWFGSVSSRNVYESNLFQYSCYLEILKRLLGKQDGKPYLVFIESPALARAIQKWASKHGIVTEIIGRRKALRRQVAHHLSFFIQWAESALVLLSRWITAYISKKNFKPKYTVGEFPVIVDTFIHDHSLSEDGVFKDQYFPYLHEYLHKNGMHVLVNPVLYGVRFNYFSIYKRMRKSKTNFIIMEDFLQLSDYVYAIFYPVRVLYGKVEAMLFRNLDLSDLLKEDRLQHVASGIYAALTYRLIFRLKKKVSDPRIVIDWYENQVINKAIIAGFRQAFPKTKIIGAQLFIHSPNFLNFYPSESEVERKMVPHILIEMSEHQCQAVKIFAGDMPCRLAASLRYSHLFADTKKMGFAVDGKITVLVLLPFDMTEAIELLEIFKSVLDQIETNAEISIKCHPNFSAQALIGALGEKRWPPRFTIFQGSIADALARASLVISSNSSSMVEAAVKGIPVIFVGRQTVLNQNPLSGLHMDIVTECFTASELISAINKYLYLDSHKIDEYKEMGKRIRSLFFTSIDNESMSPYLVSTGL